MNSKHAYLILAHNEFDILRVLLSLLDDERNDIFIHFDKKTRDIPSFSTSFSSISILDERYDIRWGHISQIKAELSLLRSATNKATYSYYHIISGTHLPLTSQDNIHRSFDNNSGLEIFAPIETNDNETVEKMKLYNFFMSTFIHSNKNISIFSQKLRQLIINMQKILNIRRNEGLNFHKASNWVSITHEAAKFLVLREEFILKRYNYTMCGDEYFIPTELSNQGTFSIKYDEKLLKQHFEGAHAKIYSLEDYEMLSTSNALFARKFTAKDMKIVHKIFNSIIK